MTGDALDLLDFAWILWLAECRDCHCFGETGDILFGEKASVDVATETMDGVAVKTIGCGLGGRHSECVGRGIERSEVERRMHEDWRGRSNPSKGDGSAGF